MIEMKIRIDYNADPNIDNKAKQVVYLEKTLDEIDITNLIGKRISRAEYEPLYNCLILTLTEDSVDMQIATNNYKTSNYAIDIERMSNTSDSSAQIKLQSDTAGSYNSDISYGAGPK